MLLRSEYHLHSPQDTSAISRRKRIYLIYFITGNPGLIGYYTTFLTHLYGLLRASEHDKSTKSITPDFHVYGRSLSGFEVPSDRAPPPGVAKASGRGRSSTSPPYSLQEQILHSRRSLEQVVKRIKQQHGGDPDVRVIFSGHSVGAYIALETMRHLAHGESSSSSPDDTPVVPHMVSGAILLFPTITHIALSPRGLLFTPFLTFPYFALTFSLFTRLLLLCIPTTGLALLLRLLLRFPVEAAQATAGFLKSADGVQQALSMARDEMLEIGADDARWWSEEIDEAASVGQRDCSVAVGSKDSRRLPRPMLKMLFASDDHWVDNQLRDELIRVRGKINVASKLKSQQNVADLEVDVVPNPSSISSSTGDLHTPGTFRDRAWEADELPTMHVDTEHEWPHAFCIHHSVPVADWTAKCVAEIVERDMSSV